MTEVFFYHLQRQPLERVLPQLLEKCLARGWRCVVQATGTERIDALDAHLWTYDDASFLPHGTDREADPAAQPILLTGSDANPNGAAVRFLVDGARIDDAGDYVRVIHLFDGNDPEALESARARWKETKAAGHEAAYWQQDDAGRWAKRG